MATKSPSHLLAPYAGGFLQLFFPNLCACCGGALPSPSHCFCMPCRVALAPSDMYKQHENEFTDRFWGRIPLQGGAAMFYMRKTSPIQQALHRLKYRNQPRIGHALGRQFGALLRHAPAFAGVTLVAPVPLHPDRERQRGYNQSRYFAEGLAQALHVDCRPDLLLRQVQTASQTRKDRMERFQNMEGVFALRNPRSVEGHHVLLADDVLTTGATLEACAEALLKAPQVRISMATIALAVLH